MEVHHHSHSARKKWTHYFWEFFMLFLAVTLGFFVENQREHLVEHNREKQYIRSMIVDLGADTTKLSFIAESNKVTLQGIDTIIAHYNDFADGHYSIPFFRYEWALKGYVDFIYTDRTINQLKSSGGMRLIRKQPSSDSIINYDDQARDYLIEQNGAERFLETMITLQAHLINYRLIDQEMAIDPQRLKNKILYVLLTHDKQEIENFYNVIFLYKEILVGRTQQAVELKKTGTRLIAFLKEQYHLK